MKLGMILSQTEPETVFDAPWLANYSLKQGSEVCPLSTLKDWHEIVRDSDRLVTF